jgi:hypothetical protein
MTRQVFLAGGSSSDSRQASVEAIDRHSNVFSRRAEFPVVSRQLAGKFQLLVAQGVTATAPLCGAKSPGERRAQFSGP